MTSTQGNRDRLEPDTWRRIGMVLDRVASLDLSVHPEALADVCKAEGLRVEQVEPFVTADRRSDRFLERLDDRVVDGALRSLAAETRWSRVWRRRPPRAAL